MSHDIIEIRYNHVHYYIVGLAYNAVACNLEVFLGQRGLMEMTMKVASCSGWNINTEWDLDYIGA